MAGRKLLLADDSITIQKVVNLTFADEGVEVLSVGDGDAAVQRISEEFPDIVLADVNMPGRTGYQVCEYVRGDERTRHIPVLLLVGAFEQFDDAEAHRVGASGHLTKPFQSIRQLVNQVTDLIEESRQTRAVVEEPVSEPVPQEPETSAPQSALNPFDHPVTSQFESFREDRIASIDHERQPLSSAPSEPTGPQTETAGPEAEDIDKLYRQSIGDEQATSEQFPDVGVDDEMIETSYTAPEPESDLLEPVEDRPDYDDGAFAGSNEVHPSDLEDTQPLSPYETTNLSAAEIPVQDAPETSGSDQTVRLDPAMVEARMAEANKRFGPAEQSEATEPKLGEETIRMEGRFDTQPSATYEFEDADLLDIPSDSEVEITAPADAVGKGGNKQIVTLSPELIEMIAQRVVEKLSEKY